jgi:hypothetical protein
MTNLVFVKLLYVLRYPYKIPIVSLELLFVPGVKIVTMTNKIRGIISIKGTTQINADIYTNESRADLTSFDLILSIALDDFLTYLDVVFTVSSYL